MARYPKVVWLTIVLQLSWIRSTIAQAPRQELASLGIGAAGELEQQRRTRQRNAKSDDSRLMRLHAPLLTAEALLEEADDGAHHSLEEVHDMRRASSRSLLNTRYDSGVEKKAASLLDMGWLIDIPPPPVNCEWLPWYDWGPCPYSCHDKVRGMAQHEASRGRTRAMNGGKQCEGPMYRHKECEGLPCCKVHCVMGLWNDWGECSATCGGGLQKRQREIKIPADCGGRTCLDSDLLEYQRVCAKNKCESHCVWGPWHPWLPCSKPCEGGKHKRYRTATHATNCTNRDYEEKDCNTHTCDRDCKLGKWQTWGPCLCNAQFTSATMERKRVVRVKSTGFGYCPPMFDYFDCTEQVDLKRDCPKLDDQRKKREYRLERLEEMKEKEKIRAEEKRAKEEDEAYKKMQKEQKEGGAR